MGMGEKTRKIYTWKNKEKIPRLVALPSPLYEIGRRLFSGPKRTGNKPDLP